MAGDAKNNSNIKAPVAKGMGILNDIFNILEQVTFGEHYFQIALLLRESLLVNSVLYNSSVWYNLTQKDINELSYLDKVFYSRLYSIPMTAPSESFYLENGALDFNTIIKARRIIYFHNVLNRNRSQLIYSFMMSQIAKKSKFDWVSQVLKDLEDFKISASISYLQNSLEKALKK